MITVVDVLSPAGEIDDSLFPGEDEVELSTRVEGYITDAYQRTDAASLSGTQADNAATAWVYHRAYKAVLLRLSASPATTNIQGEVSTTYTASQMSTFQKLVDDYLTEFNALIAGSAVPTKFVPSATSRSVDHRVGW